MISPNEFVDALANKGFFRFTGVPCSFFQTAINYVIDDPKFSYTMVPNEGSALALAAGACLAGRPTVLLIQNSGLGNLVNPLTSLNMIYKLPVPLFISGRAYGVSDEPQHEIIGNTMGSLLDALGLPHADMPTQVVAFHQALDKAARHMKKKKTPFAFFVRKGTLDEYAPNPKATGYYPLKRVDAIRLVMDELEDTACVIATTGKPSRELFAVRDRARNFYMQGSMGHAASIGLGIALSRPDQKVVVLDGDGAILMHLGILSSVGFYKPKNFFHVVLDNEAYETTGNQDTTSPSTDFCAAALACGYLGAETVSTETDLKKKLRRLLASKGPSFLRIKISRLATDAIPIPRISSKYSSEAIAANFKKAISKKRTP